MQIWLAILDRDGVAEDEVDRFSEVFLPFHPETQLATRWRSPAGTAGLWTWSNGPVAMPAGAATNAAAAVAVAGYVLAEDGALLTPTEVAVGLARGGDEPVRSWGGVFSIARVRDSVIEGWNALARLEHVYWHRQAGRVVVSSRALAAHLVGTHSRTPTYDRDFLTHVLASGFPTTEHTPFEGVETLGPQQHLAATTRQTRVRTISSEAPDDPVTAVASGLTSSIAFVPGVDPHSFMGVTGGKDSRVVAAAMASSGSPFKAITGGLSEHPDVIVAERVTEILGIPHLKTGIGTMAKDSITVEIIAKGCERLLGSDGSHPAFEWVHVNTRVASLDRIALGGQGGELLRGGYAKSSIPSMGSAAKRIENLVLRNRDLLSPDAGLALAASTAADVELCSLTEDPADTMWEYYLRFRSGRWAAAAFAASSVGRTTVWPFFDARVVGAARHMSTEDRISELAVFEILGRLSKPLTTLPLAGARWNFEKQGPRPGDEAGYTARTPLPLPAGRGSFQWRYAFSTGLGAAMADTIDGQIDRPELAGLLSGERVEMILSSLRSDAIDDDPIIGGQAWALFSVSLLLSNLWLEVDPPPVSVTIPIPD